MTAWQRQHIATGLGLGSALVLLLGCMAAGRVTFAANRIPARAAEEYATSIRPLLRKYCLDCHSTDVQKGGLDLERFAAVADLRKDAKVWQSVIEQVEAGEMPPKRKPQPTPDEKRLLLAWVREFLDREARSRIGDPGHVPLRRLSNAEYDNTIRDLTGVDLRPAREFPADGAAGEGFTNAAEALTDISPALFAKYLDAAKAVADHAVLLPDGFRFSHGKTRRDWTDEGTVRLQRFYASAAPPDGRLNVQPYLAATVRHRDALLANTTTVGLVAQQEGLNPKYLGILWQTLENGPATMPLVAVRAQWRKARLEDVPALALSITAWQQALWDTARIGNYGRTVGNAWMENYNRQVVNNPAVMEVLPLRLAVKPVPGQNEVVLRLSAQNMGAPTPGGTVVWQRPRLEGAGQPTLLLKDYVQYGPGYEVEYAALFADTAKHLTAVAEAARDRKRTVAELAQRHALSPAFLQRWIDLAALEPTPSEAEPEKPLRVLPAAPLDMLDEKLERAANKPWLNGWRKKGQELPALIANASNTVEYIPGKAAPHSITVHPTPQQFVGVVWHSPVTGKVRVTARIASVHPACGNGVAWWLEHRRGGQAHVYAEGTVELGGQTKSAPRTVNVAQGEQILLAVDAWQGDHTCDLTEIALTVTETQPGGRTWDLSGDVAGSIHAGNPHAGKPGKHAVWSFVCGPARGVAATAKAVIPPGSLLDQWRDAVTDPSRTTEAARLAEQVQALLTGSRPATENHPDRLLYDRLVSPESLLLRGLDPARFGKSGSGTGKYGLPAHRFTAAADLVAPADSVLEVRLPALLLAGREFVVEGRLNQADDRRVVRFQVTAAPGQPSPVWDGKQALAGAQTGTGYRSLLQGCADFRQVFPLFLCFPGVIANDEVVSLKMFHREDEPLRRLFLDAEQARHLDLMWEGHLFVSQQAAAENAYLPQFIEYVTQDGTKEALAFFKSLRVPFQRRADEFARTLAAARPRQLEALLAFAERAFRRPLSAHEKAGLLQLHDAVASKGMSHEEAFRGVLVRVLASPAFLFRVEQAVPGSEPGPVNDWELATRLSYFLWASMPDDELRRLAAAGQLRNPEVLVAQMRRMLHDPRVRALAIEFGTQWIHVRGFDQFNEKNEKLFPEFDASLKQALYEEAILFFQDLFQQDRPVTDLLDADATHLNEALAKHYGIPGVTGPHWRRVTEVKQHGRGGLLGLGSVQARQAGASRTSPILRGNWVVETLLGEKLPKPPPDVPKLPETEGGSDHLTMRQLVERHTQVAECATCHQRIDPFGFALEKYDAIGRRRERDLGGPVDARARLRDGTEFADLDGLRAYLLTRRKEVILRLFCRRLLGYALGRAVTLSDTHLLDEMCAALEQNQGRVSAALNVIVRSAQFRMVRGRDAVE